LENNARAARARRAAARCEGGDAYALAGIVIGAAIALAAAHWVQPLLFGETAHDPLVFAAVAAILVVVAAAASAIPAWRAARVDPSVALRTE
jgi:putative ABC transport system permease protein